MDALGTHILIEFYDCNPETLDDVSRVETSMIEAARVAEATLIQATFHHFAPFGVSGVVVIQESHLAIHTWPEARYAAVDIFTCGPQMDPAKASAFLKTALGAQDELTREFSRGEGLSLPEPLKNDPALPAIKFQRDTWFTSRNESLALSVRHRGKRLFHQVSDHQKIEVFDTIAYGKMLVLDNRIVLTQADEFIYHEMLVHVAMQIHPEPRKILVIGGGDGGAVRELLRYQETTRITVAEMDPLVSEVSQRFFPKVSTHLRDPKVEVFHEEGGKFLEKLPSESFDIILVDITLPATDGAIDRFARDLFRIMDTGALLVSQGESPRFDKQRWKTLIQIHRKVWGREQVTPYFATIPTLPGGLWSFLLCGKQNYSANPSGKPVRGDLSYYNQEIHKASFALPNDLKKILEKISN